LGLPQTISSILLNALLKHPIKCLEHLSTVLPRLHTLIDSKELCI